MSDRSGSLEIWTCNADGSNPVQLTSFGGPATTAPRFSPDGRQIVLASRPGGNTDVYIISVQGGSPRRLTTEPSEDHTARWSSDGQFMYFTKFREPDLWRIPAQGGEETRVIECPLETPWTMVDRGVYFPDFESNSLKFFDFGSRRVSTVARIEKLARECRRCATARCSSGRGCGRDRRTARGRAGCRPHQNHRRAGPPTSRWRARRGPGDPRARKPAPRPGATSRAVPQRSGW